MVFVNSYLGRVLWPGAWYASSYSERSSPGIYFLSASCRCIEDESAFQPYKLVSKYCDDRGSPTYLRALYRHYLRGFEVRSFHGNNYIFCWNRPFRAHIPVCISFRFCGSVFHHGELCKWQKAWAWLWTWMRGCLRRVGKWFHFLLRSKSVVVVGWVNDLFVCLSFLRM